VPQHEQKWVTQRTVAETQAKLKRYGAPIEASPTEALLGCLHISVGHVVWLRLKIEEPAFDDLDKYEARALIRMYDTERDRLAKLAKAALDVGVAEKHVQAVERVGEAVADLLKLVFDDPDLKLNTRQRKRLPDVLRRHFPAIQGDAMQIRPTTDDDYEEWDEDELRDELDERSVQYVETASRSRLIYLLRDDDALFARANGR
jgi:hypothetical protein